MTFNDFLPKSIREDCQQPPRCKNSYDWVIEYVHSDIFYYDMEIKLTWWSSRWSYNRISNKVSSTNVHSLLSN